ncbi:histamine H4 receptor [Manis pentadactyla]|uniref:histamine H4 receptor n=1 Tax=Manis pentadactyla TaxID=143292 RepID=UPI00255C9CD4|nr:histamine H4 receptor [Manis pentadactyla]
MSATNSTVISALSTRITLAFFMSLLAFAIMLGNAMVILAFLVDKNLRRRSNYFFLNLAISDFFVGAISIPLYIPYRMFDWNFGNKTCVFWLIIDYLLCTTSVYNIVLISYDRYQSVSNAVYYRARHTGILKMVALMLSVWALAFFVHGPAILFSQSWKIGENCEPGFFSVWYILVITSLLEFLLPIFSVAYFNMYIYWSLWKRCNLSRWQSHPDLMSPVSSRNCGLSLKCGLFSRTSLPEPKEAVVSLHSERQGRKNSLLFPLRAQMNCNVIASKVNSLFHSDSLALRQREHLELLKARKLGKSLAILLGIFIFCWAPFTLFSIVRSTYSQDQRCQTVAYEITFWLQWLNSLVNPFLYPLCHKHFQRAFLKMFCMKKQSSQSSPSHKRSTSS